VHAAKDVDLLSNFFSKQPTRHTYAAASVTKCLPFPTTVTDTTCPFCPCCVPAAKDMDLLSQLIAKQPTVLLSSLDALLRSKAVTEASNTVFCRRVFLYNAPPGIHIPELMRMLQVGRRQAVSLQNKSWCCRNFAVVFEVLARFPQKPCYLAVSCQITPALVL
jgi:hypothetical protein